MKFRTQLADILTEALIPSKLRNSEVAVYGGAGHHKVFSRANGQIYAAEVHGSEPIKGNDNIDFKKVTPQEADAQAKGLHLIQSGSQFRVLG